MPEPTRLFEIVLTEPVYKLMVSKAKSVFSNQEIRETGIDQIITDFICDAIRDDLLHWFPDEVKGALKP
jgi:hypothetical protein